MERTRSDELASIITPQLMTYLGAGQLNPSKLARSVDYSGLAIDDLERLKQLHFALLPQVVDYVDKLERRLRRVKIEHRHRQETTHGEVRGPVDWPRTLQKRSQASDPVLFVIDSPEVEFDIPENRVVKKLIASIAEPLTTEIEGLDREWRQHWDDDNIISLKRTLEHNVYLNELPAAAKLSITDRDLSKARRSRHRLYSEAAELYRLYDDLRNDRYHRPGVQELLRKTIVTPTQDHTLFELTCIFAEISRLRVEYAERFDADLTLQRIKPGMEELALLTTENHRVEIYYDQGGPLSFFEELTPSEELEEDWIVPEPIVRKTRALEKHASRIESFLGEDTDHTFYSGRPDLVVVEYTSRSQSSNEAPDRIRLGEVKYTTSRSTFSSGLLELLEYIYLAETGDRYIFESGEPGPEVDGIIYSDAVQTEMDQVGEITHRTTEEIRRMIDSVEESRIEFSN